MFKFVLIFVCSAFFTINAFTQYAPPVGQAGCTAVKADSSAIIGWAVSCTVSKGYKNIADTSLGRVSSGSEINATGQCDNSIVSLGDSGYAVLTFDYPLVNGQGPDFAVFENSFNDDYLELAHVEVSSDGINFFRFPSVSLTDTSTQVGSFGTIDATKIYNLAGKYRGGYGTPFDLENLKEISGLDINNITDIKIIDVIGSVNTQYASYDSCNNIINDPYPTAFESGGFDLDAVAVINNTQNSGIKKNDNTEFNIYYSNNYIKIKIKETGIKKFFIYDISGKIIVSETFPENNKTINIEPLNTGIYILKIINNNKSFNLKLLIN